MCVSTVRVSTADECPQTSVSSSSRDATAPRRRSSATSRSNSIGVSGTDLPGAPHGSRRPIHFDVAESLDRGGRPRGRAAAPQQRLDSRQQLEDAERLGDVVVRAEPEAAHLVRLLAPRREDQHRHRQPVVAQLPQHAVAVHARQHQVEDDEIGTRGARAGEAGRAVGGHVHVVALDLQVVAQTERQVVVVLDDEDAGHATRGGVRRSGSRRRGARRRSARRRRRAHPGATAVQFGELAHDREADAGAAGDGRRASPAG